MNEQIVNKGLELLTTAATLAVGEAPKVLQEYLNLMTMLAVFDLAKLLVYGAIPFVVYKILTRTISYSTARVSECEDHMSKRDKDGTKCTLCETRHVDCPMGIKSFHCETRHVDCPMGIKSFHEHKDRVEFLGNCRFALFSLTVLGLGLMSISSFERIGKILIAPRVFMLQEGAALLRHNTAKPVESK